MPECDTLRRGVQKYIAEHFEPDEEDFGPDYEGPVADESMWNEVLKVTLDDAGEAQCLSAASEILQVAVDVGEGGAIDSTTAFIVDDDLWEED